MHISLWVYLQVCVCVFYSVCVEIKTKFRNDNKNVNMIAMQLILVGAIFNMSRSRQHDSITCNCCNTYIFTLNIVFKIVYSDPGVVDTIHVQRPRDDCAGERVAGRGLDIQAEPHIRPHPPAGLCPLGRDTRREPGKGPERNA